MFSPKSRGIAVLAAAAAAIALLAGCGHKGTAAVTNHNAADITFATQMIPHHEQAIQMADLAKDRASNPDVKALATRIKNAQEPEVSLLSGWLKTWSRPMPKMSSMGQMGDGMMSDQDLAKLQNSSGSTFDRLFLQLMIAHHQGAVDMARTERSNGTNVSALKLAKDIISSQSAEITEMQQLEQRV